MVVSRENSQLIDRLDGNRLDYHLIQHSMGIKTPIFVVHAGFEGEFLDPTNRWQRVVSLKQVLLF